MTYKAQEKPHKWLKPHELIVLTDGNCGSTCAQFMLVLNEKRLATTAGVGGISEYTMAVSSYVGGSKLELKEFLELGRKIHRNLSDFVTSASWGFTFQEAYSKIYTDTPAQFVQQPPTIRIPWWDFARSGQSPSTQVANLERLYSLASDELFRLNFSAARD
jgi:hypothetical protein